MRVQLYSLREKSTKRLRALAHLMGSRVLHVLYIYCARTCTRIFARRACWALDLPRLLSLSLSLLWKIPHGATRWAQGPSAPCHRVPFVTSHVARMFPFSRPASSPPKLWEDSRSVCSSFFLFMRSIKKGTRPSSLGEPFRRVQPASSNPFASGYVCAPREGLCGLSAATDI